MQVSKLFIDYVIVHELCYLADHNHSTAFSRLLDRMMPGLSIAENILERRKGE